MTAPSLVLPSLAKHLLCGRSCTVTRLHYFTEIGDLGTCDLCMQVVKMAMPLTSAYIMLQVSTPLYTCRLPQQYACMSYMPTSHPVLRV